MVFFLLSYFFEHFHAPMFLTFHRDSRTDVCIRRTLASRDYSTPCAARSPVVRCSPKPPKKIFDGLDPEPAEWFGHPPPHEDPNSTEARAGIGFTVRLVCTFYGE